MRFDSLQAQVEAGAYRRVRSSFCDEPQHFTFTFSEHREFVAGTSHQSCDDRGIDDALAACRVGTVHRSGPRHPRRVPSGGIRRRRGRSRAARPRTANRDSGRVRAQRCLDASIEAVGPRRFPHRCGSAAFGCPPALHRATSRGRAAPARSRRGRCPRRRSPPRASRRATPSRSSTSSSAITTRMAAPPARRGCRPWCSMAMVPPMAPTRSSSATSSRESAAPSFTPCFNRPRTDITSSAPERSAATSADATSARPSLRRSRRIRSSPRLRAAVPIGRGHERARG